MPLPERGDASTVCCASEGNSVYVERGGELLEVELRVRKGRWIGPPSFYTAELAARA